MALRSTGAGLFTIPTAPSAGTAVASSSLANTYTATYVQMTASVPAGGVYITGFDLTASSTLALGYCNVQLGVGTSGSEVTVGQIQGDIGLSAPAFTGGKQGSFASLNPWLAVSSGLRIAAKTADDQAATVTWNLTLQCIAITNVVDAAINESANVVQFGGSAVTGRDIGASVLLSSGTGTGQLSLAAGLVTLAGVTHTGAVIPTVTALTNAPTAGDFTSTMKASLNAATPASVTGAVGSVTGAVVLPSIPTNWITSSGINAASMNGKGDWLTSAGTLATVTNLTNAPTVGDFTTTMKASLNAATPIASLSGDFTTTMKASIAASAVASVSGNVTGSVGSIASGGIIAGSIAASALNGKGDWTVGKTGYSLSVQDWSKAGDAMSLTTAYDAAKTALASTDYTAPDNASITGIKLQTDQFVFTVAGKADVNLYYVNGHLVTGDGKTGTEWGPA